MGSNCKFSVYIDNAELAEGVDYTETSNGTHHTLSINYPHSSHLLEIFGTAVIPDFAEYLILPFTMTATLVALALRKKLKKHHKPI